MRILSTKVPLRESSDKSPVALFVYNRPVHTRRTIEALARNVGAEDTALFIFSDAPRCAADADLVGHVRAYLHTIRGFKNVVVTERARNLGLAGSIIDGVTSVCLEYGRVVVLEDDLETSSHFLEFMNDALRYYESLERVMHVSGCTYPVGHFEGESTYFLRVPLCWGWGTWQRAWSKFSKDLSVMELFDRRMIRRFDFDDTYPYWRQMEQNRSGQLDTWFVFWYATLFMRDGLSLFPARSLVRNIGFDNSGVNCGTTADYDVDLSTKPIELGPIPLSESTSAFERHKQFFRELRPSFPNRVLRRFRQLSLRFR